MHSPATVDSLEAALERAISRFDDGSVIGAQMRHHFRFGRDGRDASRDHARLSLAAAREEGGSVDDALDPACAVETVYGFSLIHEDIEDAAAARDGDDSVWTLFGLAHGINAGDALCAVAHLALLDGTAPRSPADTVAMTRVLHDAHLAMCGGHGSAIAFQSEQLVSVARYDAMIDGKTAALFAAACEIGALAARAPAERARAYAMMGTSYGRALHVAADMRRTWDEGDARIGWTYPVVRALSGAPSRARERIAEQYANAARGFAVDRAAVVAALDDLGEREAARRAVEALVADADRAAAGAGIDRGRGVRAVLQQALRRRAA